MVRLRRTHRPRRSSTISGDTNGQTDTTIFRIRTSQLRSLALRGVRPPASHWSRPSGLRFGSGFARSLRGFARNFEAFGLGLGGQNRAHFYFNFANNFHLFFEALTRLTKATINQSRSKSFFGLLRRRPLRPSAAAQNISATIVIANLAVISYPYYGPAFSLWTHRLGGVRRFSGTNDRLTDSLDVIFRIRTSQLRCLALRGVRPPASHWSRPSASIWRASPAVYALRANFRGLRPRPTSEVKTEVTFLFQLFAGNNFAFIGRGANAPPKARKSRSKSFFGLLTAFSGLRPP